jgi:fluoroquinolone transport system ATP-binding protein
MLKGYQGSASIDGRELKDYDKALYQKIGVGLELPNHYLKITALENLKFFAGFYAQTRDPLDLLDLVGLKKDAHKKVTDFSKGMKMRLNFVRSFMHDPNLLFLDEPTSGLDPVNSRLVKDIILDLKSAGKTVFLTTHQMYDADELCDRVAFIVDGKIMAMDQPQNLKLQYSKKVVNVLVSGQEKPCQFPLDGLGENQEFLDLIRQNQIETIHSKEASLDEIFIDVTGKELV